MADQLIKRAVVGGFVKADVTGTGDWDYGRITAFDGKTITFDSIIDGKEIKVQRAFAFKSNEKEMQEAARSIDRNSTDELGFIAQQKERRRKQKAAERHHAAALKRKRKPVAYERQGGRICSECGAQMKPSHSPEDAAEGITHRCNRCGHTEQFKRKTAVAIEYYERYEKNSPTDVKTASGRRVIDTGDDVAQQLRGMSLDEVYTAVAERMLQDDNYTTEDMLRERYEHLNAGMQRMNLGNLLRAHLRRAAKKRAAKVQKKEEE